MQQFSSYNWFTQQWKSQSSFCSAMQWATGLQFYYVVADLKEVNNIFKPNTLNAIVFKLQLIYSKGENLQVTIAQLSQKLQACNFTMLWVTQK